MERINRDDMALVLKKFDSDYDGRLTYFDFEKAISPVSEEYASILMNRSSHYQRRAIPLRDYFCRDTRLQFAEVFRKLLATEYQCEQLR